MGAWGTAIFSDDLACDVRDTFESQIEQEHTAGEATAAVLQEFGDALEDADEANVVWLALAAAQVRCRMLQEEVRSRAIAIIESGADLGRWEESPADQRKRRAALDKLLQRIQAAPIAAETKKRRRPKEQFTIGDIFAISLPDGRYAYAQYVYYDGGHPCAFGYLVRVFDLITPEPVSADRVVRAREAFPPVFVALTVPVRMGRWRKIGHQPVENFRFPLFRTTNGTKPGVYHDWGLWDRGHETFLGDLPRRYARLEKLCIWGDDLLAERIVSGRTIDSQIR